MKFPQGASALVRALAGGADQIVGKDLTTA
jgi:hypothetical protein